PGPDPDAGLARYPDASAPLLLNSTVSAMVGKVAVARATITSVTGANAADPAAVAQRFLEVCRSRFGADLGLVEPATSVGQGFDTAIAFVHLRGTALPAEWRRPLVLRIQPHAERLGLARREALVQTWCADRSFPAPRVL